MRPTLIYTIKLQPKTGKYALRDGKAVLLGVFDNYSAAERDANERFPLSKIRRIANAKQ